MTPRVLVHGGGFGASCWDRLLPHLTPPVLAVDLPGRGARPAVLRDVTLGACADAVVEDIDKAGFDEVVLVGHSLAGCSMPAMTERLGERVRHLVFVSCTVPEDGTSCFDTLDPEVQAIAGEAAQRDELGVLDPETAKAMFASDLDEAGVAFMLARMVPEAPRITIDPVDLAPFRTSTAARTWVRLLRDDIVPPAKQDRFAANVGRIEIVDLDAAHMAMISRPRELAAILNSLAS